jgi:mRNA-degrading endonuclease RelE of RelBE toxin-antitoxin system
LQGDYRLRVGGWRALFTPDAAEMVLHVYAIVPRGGAYRR